MLRALIGGVVFALGIETTGRAAYRRLLAAAWEPRAAQERALAKILHALAPTELGRTYGYAQIAGPDEFRRRVPVHDYEALRPHVARQIATGARVLTPTPPIMYARTSGTTGQPKLVPVTSDGLATLQHAQRVFSYVQHRQLHAFRGRVLAIGGALREETLPDGTPAGSATGLIYATMPRLIRHKYVVPAEVFEIEDYELRYALIARLAVQHRSLSLIATANPSTILRL
ncbi:MAG TPA: GH3 auxin-responsive promoter family protein, partial [Gammaproteobacteria bacterium]|nr:GH3 auxin-responsive promoter family protein [Gammaproteobacteria bacterium]